MAARDEIARALSEVIERVEGLRPSAVERPEAPLPEGEWRVRDALSHLAARATSVRMIVDRYQQATSGAAAAAARPAGIDIHAVNRRQLEERSDRGVEEILKEVVGGRQEAIRSLDEIDEALLKRMVPNFRGDGEMPLGEMVLRASARHDMSHLDQIEQALSAAATRRD
jgi:hypothetical protein